jgi:hypothetical protein
MPIGSPITVPPGDPEDFLVIFDVKDFEDGLGAKCILQAAPDYGEMYYVVVCDGMPQAVVYLKEGIPKTSTIIYDAKKSTHAVSIVCLGEWDTIPANTNVVIQQDYFTVDKGLYLRVTFDATIEQDSYDDLEQLSSWNLTGLERFLNCLPVSSARTQLDINILLISDGSVRTLTLFVKGQIVATGSITGTTGTITLTEANDSGLNGTVALAYTADLEAGIATFRARYSRQYKIFVDSVLDKTINENGRANEIGVLLGPLSGGNHSITVRSVSDTGIEGTLSAPINVTIPSRPNPPQVPYYVSGDYSNTLIRWQGSTNAGIHKVYDSALNYPTDLDTAVQTTSGIGLLSATLPAITAAQGTRRVVVSAFDANGVDDGFRREVKIKYDTSGNYLFPSPNIPGFNFNRVESGNKMFVDFYLNTIEEEAPSTKAHLFLFSGTAIWDTPRGMAGIPAGSDVRRGTLSAVVDTNGFYKFGVRTLTLSGIYSENVNFGGPIWLNTTVPPAPSNIVGTVLV